MDKIKTLADVYAYKKVNPEDVLPRVNYCGNVDFTNACMLTEVLNEGWIPNWENDSELKYYPWFYMLASGSGFRLVSVFDYACRGSYVSSRLVFRTEELARYAATQFIDVYKGFMTIYNKMEELKMVIPEFILEYFKWKDNSINKFWSNLEYDLIKQVPMSNPTVYILQRDTPDAKAGTKYYKHLHEGVAFYYSSKVMPDEDVICDIWTQQTVENKKEWFLPEEEVEITKAK